MRRACLSALHFVKSARMQTNIHIYTHCRVFYLSQVLFNSLRESDSGKSLLRSPATPDLLPKPNNTAEFPHGRVVVVQVAIITQSTFCIT